MTGRGARKKGHDFERELVWRFREAMPGAEVKRGIGQSRQGNEVADVEVPCFWVEAKRGRKPNPRAALEQAKAATDGRVPVAVIRDDRKPAFVVMDFEQFLDFVGEWWAKRGDIDEVLRHRADRIKELEKLLGRERT